MIYKSDSPRIVGGFDATQLHDRINEILEASPGSSPFEVQRQLAGGEFDLMKNIVEIKWNRLFFPGAFENIHSDGQFNDLVSVSGYRKGLTDGWHADTAGDARVFKLTEFLTGASRWPTEFLVGRIELSGVQIFDRHWNPNHRWDVEDGKAAIDNALERGDAEVVSYSPGQMLRVPAGTLHRRNIPGGESGLRYFIRHYPRFGFVRHRAFAQKLRPL